MDKPRVMISTIFLRPGDEVDRRLLDAGFEPFYKPFTGRRTEDELIQLLQGVQGAIVSMDPFTDRVLAAAPCLKAICRTGVGYDAIDLSAATARGIIVTTTPGVNRHAVADLTMGFILLCSRRISENLAEVRRGGWKRHEGMDLTERTLGIVGLGTIGKEVAQRAAGFRMKLLAYDTVQDMTFTEKQSVKYVRLEELLRQSDFVSLHLFLNSASKHLINAERLKIMKPTAFLVNTARGGLVDTKALCHALVERQIAGAALDVFEEEPLPTDSLLRSLPNVYMTPHIGGTTSDARWKSGLMAAENLIRALNGCQPEGIVNPKVLERR
jgi:D-3-phosphoglycerate dehydrogenase/(S)-sulfolactate dehydrogenase